MNGAQSGAVSRNMVSQWNYVLKRTNDSDLAIDVAKDWKLVTILIGANDACGECERRPKPDITKAADEFESHHVRVIAMELSCVHCETEAIV